MSWHLLQLLFLINAKNSPKYSFRGFRGVNASKSREVALNHCGCSLTSFTIFADHFIIFDLNPDLVFLLILCSQTYLDVAKAQIHYYMYSLYRSPAAFYECLITVVITLLCTTATHKNFLYYSLLFKCSASTYESSDSQFIRTTTGIQSGPMPFINQGS